MRTIFENMTDKKILELSIVLSVLNSITPKTHVNKYTNNNGRRTEEQIPSYFMNLLNQ